MKIFITVCKIPVIEGFKRLLKYLLTVMGFCNLSLFFMSSLFSFLVMNVNGVSYGAFTTFNKLYDLGMDAYKQEKWESCISFFNSAIEDYKFYQSTVTDCRLQCKASPKEIQMASVEDVYFDFLSESKCLRKCKKIKFGQRQEEEVASSYEKKFQDRQPYNYLQFCYFKNGEISKAASTAYTYYITHQDDERVLETLNYYKELPDIDEKDFEDLERKPYQKAYIEALVAYNEGDWSDAAEKFERSLTEYYKEEERCRAYCEKGFVHSRFPDFVNAVADHYVMVVVCQQKCLKTLSTFGMEEIEDYISEHYNYLQYSYYQARNMEKAFESIASFLLFKPQNVEMLNNKEFYINRLGHDESEFTPSQAAVEYAELWQKLDKSISFIREEYLLPSDLVEEEDSGEEEGTEKSDQDDREDVEDSTSEDDSEPQHYMAKFEKLGVKLQKDMGSNERFVADNLIREDQCQCLSDPVKEFKADTMGIKSLELPELTEMVKTDSDNEIALRLLMRAATVMTIYTQAYFNKTGLFVKQVKVVCLPAGDNKLPEDCNLQEDGTCLDSLSAGVYRSVAYLTDITDGTGQLYFVDEVSNIQSHVAPKCGRLLGFKGENKHGVNLSWKKERCAIVVDISENEEDLYEDFFMTKQYLKDLQDSREVSKENIDNSDILNQFYNQGVTIVQTGEDLYGTERFVADGLSTDEECKELVEIAKKKAVSGDGYRGNVSPHTEKEIFSGLDISLAEQRGVIKGDGYQDDESTAGSKFVSPYTKNEKFEGLNVSRSLEMVDSKLLSSRSLHLLLDISENGRILTEKYFNLTKPLYFDFTHLVCRTAIEESDTENAVEEEEELSHPVHADNCVIQPNGSCIADANTFKQRHYSAVLYLNDEFEGGQFFFAHNDQTEQVSVEPKCGRIVAFNAGEYHGVRAVKKGQRCAIAMWYTHDPNYSEVSRVNARRRLQSKTAARRVLDTTGNQGIDDLEKGNLKEDVLKPELMDLEKGHDEL